MRNITFAEAIREALLEEMEKDPAVFVLGEDIGVYGGARGITRGFLKKFGSQRVLDTPLSETAIIGGGVGAALAGLRPVCELMLMGFSAVCFDEIQNLGGKWPFIHGDASMKVPMVIRGPYGAGDGGIEPHAQCPEAFFMHCPGLKIAIPYTPGDAKGLLKTAIRDDHPVLFFEHERLYSVTGPVPDGDFSIPFGQAEIMRPGKDATVLGVSYMVHQSLAAADRLKEEGIEIEVINLRTLIPLDEEMIFDSLKKTGRLVIVQEAYRTAGYGAEISALAAEKAFGLLKAPVERVTAPDFPIPYSASLKKGYFPDAQTIAQAVKRALHYS
ncbi:MAG: alpha-ketoacid dehydrogenase subunit beta [Deltaproteobacteria bacterium]|nr:alpha-ketoacid dehydrogenase subunit beta [Deltaproteobacteria bacterium]